jgi:restriction endonuclease S subunit
MIETDTHISKIIDSLRLDVYFHKVNSVYQDFVPLSKYVNVKGGKRIPKGMSFSEKKTDYLYLRISDIDDFERINYTKFKYIDNDVYTILKRYEIAENDLAISIAGTIGRIIFLKHPPKKKKIILTENCALLAISDNNLLPEYLKIILDFPIVQEQINRNRIQTTIPKIGLDRISKLQIPKIPSKEIQQKIVDLYNDVVKEKQAKEQEAKTLLDSIDDYLLKELGIELPENSANERFFEVSISELVGNRLDPSPYNTKFKSLQEMISISSLAKVCLKDIITHSVAGDWGVDEGELAGENYTKCLVIRSTEFDNKYNLKLDNSRVKYRNIKTDKLNKMDIQPSDLLIEKSGGSPDQPVGRIAFLTESIVESNTLCYSNFIHKIKLDNSKVIPEYVYFFLKTMYNIGFTESMQSQTNGIRNLIMGEYFKQYILLPEKNKQQKIAENIQVIQTKAKLLQKEAREVLEKVKREVEKMIEMEK